MEKLFCLLVLSILTSCSFPKNEFSYIDLSKSIVLDSAETIFDFEDKYPISVKASDSLLYVIQIKSNNCMMTLNLNTNKLINSFGHVGHGPNELVNPDFILSTDNSEILIEDGDSRKIMKVYQNSDTVKLVEYIKYPEAIFISSEINFSENFIVGRKVDALEGKMFFVYNRNTGTIFEEDYFPKLNNPVSDLNYTFAPAIAFNEQKNRIVAGMYFFDMFHLYDLTGKRINTFCFSEKSIPKVKKKALNLQDGYSGIIRVFPTDDYCYLFRITKKPTDSRVEKMIIQINWEGELINSYRFMDDISGQFYVDENSRKLYIIRNYINLEDNEIYGIVSYDLS